MFNLNDMCMFSFIRNFKTIFQSGNAVCLQTWECSRCPTFPTALVPLGCCSFDGLINALVGEWNPGFNLCLPDGAWSIFFLY